MTRFADLTPQAMIAIAERHPHVAQFHTLTYAQEIFSVLKARGYRVALLTDIETQTGNVYNGVAETYVHHEIACRDEWLAAVVRPLDALDLVFYMDKLHRLAVILEQPRDVLESLWRLGGIDAVWNLGFKKP